MGQISQNCICKSLTNGMHRGTYSLEGVIDMPKEINYSFRMDPEMKTEADILFKELGMNLATALTIFVQQSLRERRIPFAISLRDKDNDLDDVLLEAIDAVSG